MSDYVGRVMVVIPALDLGFIAQFHENLTLPNGHENVIYAEVKAIKQADSLCNEKALKAFKIYADNRDAIEIAGLTKVERPDRRLNVANEYLRSLLSYAGYSRGSKGARRSRTSRKRLEVVRLMNENRWEFKLSDSPLYPTYQAKAKRKGWTI